MEKSSEMHKLKVYTIKRLREMKKLIEESNEKKEWLTVNEAVQDFNISRKTLDRLRIKGLNVYQPKRNGKILINRTELVTFLNQ